MVASTGVLLVVSLILVLNSHSGFGNTHHYSTMDRKQQHITSDRNCKVSSRLLHCCHFWPGTCTDFNIHTTWGQRERGRGYVHHGLPLSDVKQLLTSHASQVKTEDAMGYTLSESTISPGLALRYCLHFLRARPQYSTVSRGKFKGDILRVT
jgi:hypothetical protein